MFLFSFRVENRLPGMKRPLKPIPVFRQEPGEGKKRFFERMEKTVKQVIERSKYEDKYNVEVTQDEVTGQTKVRDRPKDDVEMGAEEMRIKRLARKGIAVKTKEEKRQLKRLAEKEKRWKKKRKLRKQMMNADGEWEEEEAKQFEEKARVAFNDVALHPPNLKENLKRTKEKMAKTGKVKKNNSGLLLAKKLAGPSMAKQKMLEEERLRVVSEYRNIKAGKLSKVSL
jgi:hypothetical protein